MEDTSEKMWRHPPDSIRRCTPFVKRVGTSTAETSTDGARRPKAGGARRNYERALTAGRKAFA